MAIEVFSFFSGLGFMDLGFEEAGFDIAFVNVTIVLYKHISMLEEIDHTVPNMDIMKAV